MYDVVIIGAGPAGLSASIYAKRAGLSAVTVEQSAMSGGQVLTTYEVDNYPGFPGINGFDLGMRFREHADGLSCEFQEAEVLRVEENGDGYLVTTSRGELKTKTIVAAMGAEHAKLNIPGEEELAGMGVSYCATCDGAFFRNRTVDGVFIAVGIVPVSRLLLGMDVCDEKGYLIAGEDGMTKKPGIFAAGDIRTKKLRQIVTAVADGANAITSVEAFLNHK